MGNDPVGAVSNGRASYGSGFDEVATPGEPLACEAPPLASGPAGVTPRGQPRPEAGDDVSIERVQTPSADGRMVASWPATDTNAQRTSARAEGTYVEAGITSSRDAAYAGVARS